MKPRIVHREGKWICGHVIGDEIIGAFAAASPDVAYRAWESQIKPIVDYYGWVYYALILRKQKPNWLRSLLTKMLNRPPPDSAKR
jgi:hypothetical protein